MFFTGHNPNKQLEGGELHGDSIKSERKHGNVSHQKQADIGGNDECGKCFN